jgi:hypothetical protein
VESRDSRIGGIPGKTHLFRKNAPIPGKNTPIPRKRNWNYILKTSGFCQKIFFSAISENYSTKSGQFMKKVAFLSKSNLHLSNEN